MKNINLVRLLVLVTVCSAVTVEARKRDQFRVVYEWNTFDFKWANNSIRQDAIAAGNYIKENVIISGIRPYGDRMYLTVPRMKTGVPATLAWVPLSPLENDTSPALRPFPSWQANIVGDCRAFQSVQSIEIDTAGTMWVIDNGRTSTIDPANATATACPPSLTLIDLNDQTSLVRYTFPESVASDKSYLNDIVVDDTNSGYAYITDNSGMDPGIIVFYRKESRSWKLREANSMRASQNAIHFNLNGVKKDLTINVDGIALGPRYMLPDGTIDRNLYFCPLSSYKLFSISSSILRNETAATGSGQLLSSRIADMGLKASQTDGMIMDEEGHLFYGLVGNDSIAQWDSRINFATEQHIIAKDKNYIMWPSRFGFDNDGNLYVVVNKLLNFVAGKVNASETNYRILKSNLGVRSYLYGPPAEVFAKPVTPKNPNPKVYTPPGQAPRGPHSAAGSASLSASAAALLSAFMFSYLFYQ